MNGYQYINKRECTGTRDITSNPNDPLGCNPFAGWLGAPANLEAIAVVRPILPLMSVTKVLCYSKCPKRTTSYSKKQHFCTQPPNKNEHLGYAFLQSEYLVCQNCSVHLYKPPSIMYIHCIWFPKILANAILFPWLCRAAPV